MLVADTGPLVATADRADKDDTACRTLLEGDEGPLITTALVIAGPPTCDHSERKTQQLAAEAPERQPGSCAPGGG